MALSTGLGRLKSVQIRTDGLTACRVDVAGLSRGTFAAQLWNPANPDCARINGRLQLLLAEYRFTTKVAGLVPPGTARVVLAWKDGTTTETPVSTHLIDAFIDHSEHVAAQLMTATAVDSAGDVVATSRP